MGDSPTSVVADVDCTTEGKELCEKNDVRGYPTIKYGDVGDLKDYQGGRSYEDLKKFAGENLGLCDVETKPKMEAYAKMSAGKLEGKMRNAIKNYEVELPLMKKVLAWQKKGEGKSEL